MYFIAPNATNFYLACDNKGNRTQWNAINPSARNAKASPIHLVRLEDKPMLTLFIFNITTQFFIITWKFNDYRQHKISFVFISNFKCFVVLSVSGASSTISTISKTRTIEWKWYDVSEWVSENAKRNALPITMRIKIKGNKINIANEITIQLSWFEM